MVNPTGWHVRARLEEEARSPSYLPGRNKLPQEVEAFAVTRTLATLIPRLPLSGVQVNAMREAFHSANFQSRIVS